MRIWVFIVLSSVLFVGELILGLMPTDKIWWKIATSIALFSTYLFLLYREHYRPLVKVDEVRRRVLGYSLPRLYKELKEKEGVEIRLNIMIKKRDLLLRKYFAFEYTYNMADDPDQDLKLYVNQGVCGEAFRNEKVMFADMTAPGASTYNLDAEQREKTEHLKAIYSSPIWELAPTGKAVHASGQTGTILGVFNIDTKDDATKDHFIRNEGRWRSLLKLYCDFIALTF